MKRDIEIQQENVNTLIRLMNENPTLKVVPMVYSEVIKSDYYSWWLGEFGEVGIDECYSEDERIYFKSWDEEDLIEEAIEDFKYNYDLEHLSEESLEKLAKARVDKFDWEKVIVIRIITP